MISVGRGTRQFYSERVDGRPFVNCMFYSLSTVLRWMGYNLPIEADGTSHYGMELRLASGRSLYTDGTDDGSKGGKPQGSSSGDTLRALGVLLPSAPVKSGLLSLDDTLAILPRPGHRNRHRAVVRVLVRAHALPRHFRRFVGYDWVGNHACTLVGQRICNGEDGGLHQFHINTHEVLFVDPMGKPADDGTPYVGEWMPVDNLTPALVYGPMPDNSVGVKVTYGFRDTAVKEV